MSRKKVAAAAYSIGIDTGKNVLHVIGLDEKGAVVPREKVSRSRIAARLVNVPRCLNDFRDAHAAAEAVQRPSTSLYSN